MKKITRREVNQRLAAVVGVAGAGNALAGVAAVTPRQTEGPFYPVSRGFDVDFDLTRVEGRDGVARGDPIEVHGRVLDTTGKPIANATVDVWQANHHGRYDHPDDPNPAPLDPNFQGQGIVQTNKNGEFSFRSVIPGAYSLEPLGGTGSRCRHIHYKVNCDGYRPLTTQMYFPGDPLIEQDSQIAQVPRELWPMLISEKAGDSASGLPVYRFRLVMAPV